MSSTISGADLILAVRDGRIVERGQHKDLVQAMFSDVRTYWSGESVKRVTGYEIEGHAKDADGFIGSFCCFSAVCIICREMHAISCLFCTPYV